MQILKDHTSPESAYVVDDYPYGFRLRCKIRYWLDYHAKRGFRFMSQTSNPKVSGLVWNKPKASTYVRFGACMYLDSDSHVKWSGLSEYSTSEEAVYWRQTYGEGVPACGQDTLARWIAAKVAYDANRQSGDPLHVGLKEARDAFVK